MQNRVTNILVCAFVLSVFAPSLSIAAPSYTLLQNEWALIGIPADLGDENTPAALFGDEISAADATALYEIDWVMYKYGPFGAGGELDYAVVGLDEMLDNTAGYWLIQDVAPSITFELPESAIPAGEIVPGMAQNDVLIWDSGDGNWIAGRPTLYNQLASSYQPSLAVNYIIALQGLFPSRSSSEPFIGGIEMFAGNFAPRGWAFCNGQILPIAQFQSLYSLLGTTYGGDGRTSFALPDLRGRSPMHPGIGPGLPAVRLGQRTGSPNHQHPGNLLPAPGF